MIRTPSTWVAAAMMLAAAIAWDAPPASAQSLVEMYRTARFRVQAEQILERNGRRARPLPPEPVPYASDSLRQEMDRLFARDEIPQPQEEAPSIHIRKTDLVPKLAQGWFERTFRDVRWSYLGSNEVTATDTTYTRDLRAMMEGHFGAPTRTIADHGARPLEDIEYIQFEYWFVLNDSIPLVVMDVNGPFERGLVVATDHSYRSLLPELKFALFAPVLAAGRRAPYVDYYYLEEQRMWFITGFDGDRFFLERISRPNLALGRPHIETLRSR